MEGRRTTRVRLLTGTHRRRADRSVPPFVEPWHALHSRAPQPSRPARKLTLWCAPGPSHAGSTASSAAGEPERSQPQPESPTRQQFRIACEATKHGRSSVPGRRGEPRHSCPRKQPVELSALALFLPYSIHNPVGNISCRFGPGSGRAAPSHGRRKNATGDQPLLLLGIILQPAGNNPRYRFVPVTDQDLLACPDSPDVGAEASLQFGNIDRPHRIILAQHDYVGHLGPGLETGRKKRHG